MGIKVGAPKGGRVHWLQYELSGEFFQNYKFYNNYNYHDYRFVLYRFRTMVDEFLVVRTSKRCYRVIYYNADYNYFLYFSARDFKTCAAKIKGLYNIFKNFKPPKKPKKSKK